MHALKTLVLSLILGAGIADCFGSYLISGKINLSEEWEPKIYLSAIISLDDLHTVSEAFIVASTEIDQSGKFSFAGKDLPEDDRLYRLHICKKGDPPSTIIIGGHEENHIHFVMNNQDTLQFAAAHGGQLFNGANVLGTPPNYLLSRLNEIRTELNGSKSGYRLLMSRREELFLGFADSCTHPLPALVALEKIDFDRTFLANREFFLNFYSRWENEYKNWPYLKEFKRKIDFLSYNEENSLPKLTYLLVMVGVVALLLGFWWYKTKIRTKIGERAQKDQLRALSFQERKVYRLIGKGKSNKEISSELHIGVSTVKSHVHSIFKKLGIRSRKEVSEFEE